MTPIHLRAALAAAALVIPSTLWAAGAADAVQVGDPYVRATPAGQSQTAAYLTLTNTDRTDHALVRAASDAARTVELHTVIDENGMKKMRPVPRIEVKAGGETRLQPGGLHIMLIGVEQPLKEGASVALTLSFEDGSTRDVTAPVRAIAPSAGMSHSHHTH